MNKPSGTHYPIAKSLQPVFRVFQGNYNQLIQFLEFVEESPRRLELLSQRNNYWFYVSEEITRLFYNFAVSAMTFIERTDDRFVALSDIDELSLFINEYNQEKKKRFKESGRHQLMQGLRHYLVHVDTLQVGYKYWWGREKEDKLTMGISAEQILAGNTSQKRGHGFNKLARKELMNQGAYIGIRNLIEEYYNDVKAFNRWLWDKQTELIQKGIIPIRLP